jgi:hypothetical protein
MLSVFKASVFVFPGCFMYLSLYPVLNAHCTELVIINFVAFLISVFRVRLVAVKSYDVEVDFD